MDPILTATEYPSLINPVMTFHHDDQNFSGASVRANVSTLVFADNTAAGRPFTHRGGPIGVGTPVQLIFWGDWWQTPAGQERSGWVESSTRALLSSRYFEELVQYLGTPPAFRGSTFVVSPDPPGHVLTGIAAQAVEDLIDELIEQDEYPDPDDGPRIAFIACMPPGFDFDGDSFHVSDRQYDPPFDVDMVWYGFIRHYDENTENVDNMMLEIGKLILGITTDPEGDGWRFANSSYYVVEADDVAVSNVNGRAVAQTGYINGVKAKAYWSSRHNATVLPVDTDYSAWLAGTVVEYARRELSEGTFRPDPSDSAACSTQLPECCMDDHDYVWKVFGADETATVELHTRRFHTPVATWTINGQPVSDAGAVTVDVMMDRYEDRNTVSVQASVTLEFTSTPTSLTITTFEADGNFDVVVGCSVVDAAITGNVTNNVVVTPTVAVGFIGAVLEVEQDYVDQRAACYRAMLRKDIELKIPVGPEDTQGIDFDPVIDELAFPAFARHSGSLQIQLAKKLMRVAQALLEPELAAEFSGNLVATTPGLSGAIYRYNEIRKF
jgi:hypothetical protein